VRHRRSHRRQRQGGLHGVVAILGVDKAAGGGRSYASHGGQRGVGHSYYRHTSLIRGIACSEPDVMVREEGLADQIDELVNRLSIPDDWQKWLSASLRNNGHDPEELERERERVEKKPDRLKRAWLDLELDDKEYQAERQRLRDRLSALTPPEAHEFVQAALTLRTLGDVWPKATLHEKREMLRVIFVAVFVEVTSGKVVELTPRSAFAFWVTHYLVTEGGLR
jgi:hypothetical protein